MNQNRQQWAIRLGAFVLGSLGFFALSRAGGLAEGLYLAYEKVGITVIALLPLAAWGCWTALCNAGHKDLTLSYIGTTAQRVGLLGTVIGIVAATVRIGDSLNSGAAGAVTGALPAVGQALISTAVGFVVAIGCDFVRYMQQRNEPEGCENHVQEQEEAV